VQSKSCEGITTVRTARRVFFPLDKQLRLRDKHWSEGGAQAAVKYSAKMSFAEAAEALGELAQIDISTSSLWRLTQKWGEALKQIEEKEADQANSLDESTRAGQKESKPNQRLGAAMDGSMIYVRGEAWKELKCGCFFEVELMETLDPETKETVELGRATQNSYISHLGGPEAFGKKLWTEAKRRGWQEAADTQVVADGAAWIWNLVGDYLYDARQVVDWYHAAEHLGTAAALAFGEGTAQTLRWIEQQKTPLFQGQAEHVAQKIRELAEDKGSNQEALHKQAGYFEHHKHRMDYLGMRTDGWVIGSGMVESGGKRFKDRFAKAGMRWSRAGAERLLPVRGALLSGRFDERWRTAYNSPLN
jgi:hypothetical protein